MKRPTVFVLIALSLLAGVGVGHSVGHAGDETPAARPPSPATTARTIEPNPASDQPVHLGLVEPGRIGPIEVGMSVTDAAATGFLRRDLSLNEVCNGTRHYWTASWGEGIEILSSGRDTGTITSIGLSLPEAETAEGVTIGSTYADLKQAYGEDLIDVSPEGVDPRGVFLRDGQRYIGFKFARGAGGVTDASKVTFIEMTRDRLPSLDRSLC